VGLEPRASVREDLESEGISPGELSREDYHWEITGGGDPKIDPANIERDEDIGSSIRFSDLQSFLVVFFAWAPRRGKRSSSISWIPLARLIEAMEIDPAEQEKLLDALREANKKSVGTDDR
jgi:putative ATP-dependent endonuclease of OLD family